MTLRSEARRPPHRTLQGRSVRLEPLDPDRHVSDLYAAAAGDADQWRYLPYGPFADQAAFGQWYWDQALTADPKFYAFVDQATGRAMGVASYLRIDPAAASIEIGHIRFPPPLQRTLAATEGLFLMLAHAFDDLRYRRVEWKCNNANAASKRAAERLGFRYEGLFRQAAIVKGENRDTAWFAIIDQDWPRLADGYRRWLADENFDPTGQQRRRLADCLPLQENAQHG